MSSLQKQICNVQMQGSTVAIILLECYNREPFGLPYHPPIVCTAPCIYEQIYIKLLKLKILKM